MTRTPSHDFGERAAAYELDALPKQIEESTQRVLSGELDDNLVVIFDTLAKNTAELGCLRYFYAGATTEETLDCFAQSALATSNMFRLLGTDDAASVNITWADTQRTVPKLSQIDLHNSIKIPFGLSMALLSGQADELAIIASIERQQYVHPQITQHEFILQYTQYLQLLFLDSNGAKPLKAQLQDQVAKAYSQQDPDSIYLRAKCDLFLALPESESEQLVSLLENLLNKHQALFDSERNNMRWNILGLISTDALAAAVIANRLGYNLQSVSPYIPRELLAAAIDRNSVS